MASPASMVENVPVGYRFRPTDVELVDHYLKHKLLGDDSLVHIIPEIDLCKFEPWDLPALSVVKSDDPEWFFFSPRGLKYTNSKRYNRKTRNGYWKSTGKDRDIKIRGTGHVIGTKKTLVFYTGRVSNGVKTNWVIHEYQAVTFPDDKRAFVLCRLIKKPENKAEEGTHASIGEGEPNSHMASDFESQATAEGIPDVFSEPEVNPVLIFQEPPQAEEYGFPSLLQSPIVTELEPSFYNSQFPTAYCGNENSGALFPCESTEEEYHADDDFLNSILADDVYIEEERNQAFGDKTIPPQSLRRVYYESSDTDTELAAALDGNILDTTPAVSDDNVNSREYRIMTISKTLHGAVPAGSGHEVNSKNEENIFLFDSWGVDTSSGDSTSDKPLSNNVTTRIDSFPSPPRIFKTQRHQRLDNFVSQRASIRRSQIQRKVSSIAVSQNEAQKKTHILELKKGQQKAQGTSSRKSLETASDQSSGINGISSFFYLETPSLSQNPRPRSVYLVNVILGFALLIVTCWDLISSGNCC